MNIPYEKKHNLDGTVANPIKKSYISIYANRRNRREAGKYSSNGFLGVKTESTRKNGNNRKLTAGRVNPITNSTKMHQAYLYPRVNYKTI